jgi:hypothetical protein
VSPVDVDQPNLSPPSDAAAPARPDPALAAAIEIARDALAATGLIGDQATGGLHLGVRAEADLVVTHAFAADLPGYVGWYWAVSLARAPRSKKITVDEVVLLPGVDALLAPNWVPWSERLRPSDLGPGDLVPTAPDDFRLVPGYLLSDDPAVEEVSYEAGLGRERVLSRDGRIDAAQRWYEGESGPTSAMARMAPAQCGTCAFYLPLAGSLRAGFGGCGNEYAAADGRVVSVEYGCGAHSDALAEVPPLSEPLLGPVYDDGDEVLDPGSL